MIFCRDTGFRFHGLNPNEWKENHTGQGKEAERKKHPNATKAASKRGAWGSSLFFETRVGRLMHDNVLYHTLTQAARRSRKLGLVGITPLMFCIPWDKTIETTGYKVAERKSATRKEKARRGHPCGLLLRLFTTNKTKKNMGYSVGYL